MGEEGRVLRHVNGRDRVTSGVVLFSLFWYVHWRFVAQRRWKKRKNDQKVKSASKEKRHAAVDASKKIQNFLKKEDED